MEFSVRFADGLEGRVQLRPSYLYGVFEVLKAPNVFRQISVIDGFVSWPGEIDLAPDLEPPNAGDQTKNSLEHYRKLHFVALPRDGIRVDEHDMPGMSVGSAEGFHPT